MQAPRVASCYPGRDETAHERERGQRWHDQKSVNSVPRTQRAARLRVLVGSYVRHAGLSPIYLAYWQRNPATTL